ncbi:MAG: hypothetical protein U0166_17995 [Acidobacteriota bacterium]
MRLRNAAVLGAILFVGAPLLSAYTLVRRDGRRIEIREVPDYHDGTAYFTMRNGLFGFMAETDVDRAATDRANGGSIARTHSRGQKPGDARPAPAARVYTNVDLSTATGLSVVEGNVTAEGKDAPVADPAAKKSVPAAPSKEQDVAALTPPASSR